MSAFEENEISKGANGGTEIAKRRLGGLIDPALQEHFQVIPSRPRTLKHDKIRILWCHDLPTDGEVKQLAEVNFRNKFHAIVFISNWQYQQYRNILNVPYQNNYRVLESGIDHVPTISDKPTDVVNLAYTSTPQRGLGILLPVFDNLYKENDRIHLDVFSSFKIYGWDEHDKQFEGMYDFCRNHPGIEYHGFARNDEVRKVLRERTHIHAYPSIWPETSCRAMLEAMSDGCLCVHPNFAGLTDTSGGLNMMYPGDQDVNKHAQVFHYALHGAIDIVRDMSEYTAARLKFNKAFVDTRFNITNVANEWTELMRELLNRFPRPEDRGFAEEVFQVRT